MYTKEIDKKWQDLWDEKEAFKAVDFSDKKKFYGLIEFPYPSGIGLHVGHARPFTGMDVIARKKRLEGYNVLYPMGFDAFGLPTENYAIKTGIHPRKVTDLNIETFTRQLKSIGYSFNYDRVFDTTKPEYYKWTQWIFLKLFENGLAYKENTYVNFCPKCRVILANEESQGGKCDRCDSEVVQKEKEVWMLKITDYAEKLLEGLDEIECPARIRTEQENWIGKSTGAELDFSIDGSEKKFRVYTTRPDTIFGVTYMAVAPEHPILDELKDRIENFDDIVDYRIKASKKSEFERVELVKEKTGVEVKGIKIVNPFSGKLIPLYITDYVMMGYGTGAIMAVPAHDTRDFEFAKKFNIDIIQVIYNDETAEVIDVDVSPYIGEGVCINSNFLDGQRGQDAIDSAIKYAQENNIGKSKTNYHMKDWPFARQRYWGEPVPIVKCEKCGLVALKESDLPLELPELDNFVPNEDGQSPLAKIDSWVNTLCPKCGGPAKRETDTMPQWAGSSWYFLRYIDPRNDLELASMDKLKYWLPVDWYNGGMEHVTRHLIYSRFWHRFLYDIGVVPTKEPYAKRTAQGLILGPDGEKMSKSKGNVVNPDDIVREYGADTLRTYIMFIGEFSQNAPWSENGVKGAKKFLDRVIRTENFATDQDISVPEIERALHNTIKKVTIDIDEMKFNTAVAAMMSYVNVLYKHEKLSKKYIKPFLVILSPIAPHVAEELWLKLGFEGYVFEQKWPEYDHSKTLEDEIELAVQINGVVRFKINVDSEATEREIENVALENEKMQTYLNGKSIKKIIVIKNRLVNIVIG